MFDLGGDIGLDGGEDIAVAHADAVQVPGDVDAAVRRIAETMPLDEFDVSNPALYQEDVWQPYFRRLRREAPVFWHDLHSEKAPGFWAITKHADVRALTESVLTSAGTAPGSSW